MLLDRWGVRCKDEAPSGAARSETPPGGAEGMLRVCGRYTVDPGVLPPATGAMAGALATRFNFPLEVAATVLAQLASTVAGRTAFNAAYSFDHGEDTHTSDHDLHTCLYAVVCEQSGRGKSSLVNAVTGLLDMVGAAADSRRPRAPALSTPHSRGPAAAGSGPTQSTILWTGDCTAQGLKHNSSSNGTEKMLLVVDDNANFMDVMTGSKPKPNDLGEAGPPNPTHLSALS